MRIVQSEAVKNQIRLCKGDPTGKRSSIRNDTYTMAYSSVLKSNHVKLSLFVKWLRKKKTEFSCGIKFKFQDVRIYTWTQ